MTHYPQIIHIAFALLCFACTSARESETIQTETETLDESTASPVPDAQGYCCDCNSMVGKALSCTPATADACVGITLAWCELDGGGTTSACEARCDMVGWCCECLGQPHIECWQATEDSCSYQWCHKGPLACANKCPATRCCDCTTKSCWPSGDGLDCDAPHERWCVFDPDVDCFATCD